MRDHLWNKHFVFFLGVLLIEDAVALLLETDTPETVFTAETVIAVRKIRAVSPAEIAKTEPEKIIPARLAFVASLRATAPVCVIHAILRIVDTRAVPHILATVALKALKRSAAIAQVISRTIFCVRSVVLLGDEIGENFVHLLLYALNDGITPDIHFLQKRFILCLRLLLIEHDVLLVHEVTPAETILASGA